MYDVALTQHCCISAMPLTVMWGADQHPHVRATAPRLTLAVVPAWKCRQRAPPAPAEIS